MSIAATEKVPEDRLLSITKPSKLAISGLDFLRRRRRVQQRVAVRCHDPSTSPLQYTNNDETMSDSARKKQRLSPDSITNEFLNFDLYSQPSTPFRRAASAGPGPTPGSRKTPTVRTPGTGRTPRGGPATRPLPSRRAAPTTPHAIRALRERANAARTPGHNRRRSGKIQRETPRDILRDLSRGNIT